MAERPGGGSVSVNPYTALASVYDLVMQHVDYAEWAGYVEALLSEYAPQVQDVLECGCGTGRFAEELLRLKSLRYLATDASSDMIDVARSTVQATGIEFDVADFRHFEVKRRFDAVLLLYDGINYLLHEDEIRAVLSSVRRHLRSGGVFIFDQSTPANSLNNRDFFEDSGANEKGSYLRRSEYDAETQLHHTWFDIQIGGKTFHEHHIQKAYPASHLWSLISDSEWTVLAALDGFGHDPASERSERVHWILRAS